MAKDSYNELRGYCFKPSKLQDSTVMFRRARRSLRMAKFEKAEFFPKVLVLAENRYGRDFIVGDIHGHLDTLLKILKEKHFDKTYDRLFSVGDLVDRGPDSLGVLKLLNEPWFYAVKGNHEEMLLSYMNKDRRYDFIDRMSLRNNWLKYFCEEEKKNGNFYTKLVQNLPHIITVKGNHNRFHVSHSGLCYLENGILNFFTDDMIDLWANGRTPCSKLSEEEFLWKRLLFSKRNHSLKHNSPVGLSLTYCGHTKVNPISNFCGHIGVDTGCGIPGGKLSVILAQEIFSYD